MTALIGTGPLFRRSGIPKVTVRVRARVSRVRFRVSKVRYRVKVSGPSAQQTFGIVDIRTDGNPVVISVAPPWRHSVA